MNKRFFSGTIYLIFASALALILSGAGLAQAQGAGTQGAAQQVGAPGGTPPGGQSGAKLDQTPMFNEIDKNKDDKATSEEWKASGAPDMIFQMTDSNKDGQVTLEELNASSPPADVDKDKDGKATLKEVKDFMASMPAQGGGAPGGAAQGSPQTGGAMPAGGQGMPAGGFVANSPHVGDGPTGQAFIDAMDTNKDGKIDHEEWEMTKGKTVYKNKRWPNYNKNMDNYITLDEAPQKGVNWEAAPTN
jgi:hypothetical protein